MAYSIDLSEQRFGDLVAKRVVGKDSYGNVWECKCDCGNITTSAATRLRTGRKKSCGCRLSGKRHHMWTGHEGITGGNWSHIRSHARIRNLLFEVTIEEAWSLFLLQEGKCALSGVEIHLAETTDELLYQRKNTASLDRIDSKKGYVKGNVQWVHKDVNTMKWDADQSNFIYWCKMIAQHNQTLVVKLRKFDNSRWANRKKKDERKKYTRKST